MIKPNLFLVALLATTSIIAADAPIKPGDHIAIIGNTFADQLRTHGYFETILRQRTTGHSVSIRNLGWGGDMLTVRGRPTNFPTEESTLKAHKTDVVIACFGMGESFAGQAGVAAFRTDLKAFIASHRGKSYNGKSEVRLVLVSPISYEDLGSVTPNHAQRVKELATYSETIAAVAAEAKIPFVDLNGPAAELMADETGPRLTHNGITPNAYGYWALSHHFADAILPGNASWRIEINATTGATQANGLSIKDLKRDPQGLSFTATETSGATAPPPGSGTCHNQVAANRDQLTATDLAPGSYTLSIDGTEVTTATHEEWASGVAIDNGPAHQELEAFRQRVNDKNQQFVYSWKALNQVHIVGERRTSKSGQALPAEVIAFNKLTIDRDKALQAGIPLKARQWRLIKK